MAATTTTPIVFTTGGDPVQQGYVRSLNRPGGNVTGVSMFGNLVASKGLGLLHELIPNAAVIAQLLDPNLPETARMQGDAHEAARSLGRQLLDLNASTPSELTPRLPPSASSALARFWSVAIHSFQVGGSKLLRWRRGMPFRPCTQTANLSKRAG